MKDFIIKILLLLVFTIFVHSVSAQQKVCDLQINIQDRTDKKTLTNVEAALINSTGEKFSGKVVTDNFYYSDLQEGYYELSAQSEGYKKSFKRIVLVCSEATEKNAVSKNIYLLRGNSNEKVHIIDKDFAVLQKSSFAGVNGLALSLPKPKYPKSAIKSGISGKVEVEVIIDKTGKVEWARMINGNSMFKESVEEAAQEALFIPSVVNGETVIVSGTIVYYFVP